MTASTLEKIAAREQAVLTAADQVRAQITQLTEQLGELEGELADLATARKVLLALDPDEPPAYVRCRKTPPTSTSSPPSPTPKRRDAPATCAGRS
ncbi:hypothetical protein ACFXDF_44105, partial [Streptomyces sp. NPDC059426]